MRHQRHKYKIGNGPAHRKSLIKNLASELVDHGKVKTTITKTKALKPYIERLITLAKVDTVANRRQAFKRLNNRDAVNKLFTIVAPKFVTRPGGYTRINRLADGRVGDNAKLGIISLVD